MYVVIAIAVLLLAFVPMLLVRAVMRWYGEEVPGMPGNGAELARHLLDARGLSEVGVERADAGGDHYDPAARCVRLSPGNHDGRSLTAVAVAAHEVGHAVQHHEGHPAMALRGWLAPRVQVAERVAIGVLGLAPVVGAMLKSPAIGGVMLLSALVLILGRVGMHLLTLPLEWDASFGKALPVIERGRYVAPGEQAAVRRVLTAAALTYVAAALADVLNVWRWLAILRGRVF